ncbi:hypothetical protein D044_2462A, partial [Vibrio parahaemolyticus EKP-026]
MLALVVQSGSIDRRGYRIEALAILGEPHQYQHA